MNRSTNAARRLVALSLLSLGLPLVTAAQPASDPADPADSAPAAPADESEAAGPGATGRLEPDDLAAWIDGFVEARRQAQEVVGVTVSVVQGGELIFARGYGYDDLESGRPVAADRTLFRPGSISKTFTWTAVMQLVEQGRVDLDTDIQTYLPNLEIEQRFDAPITLRHLMAHTPGYEDSAMGHLFGREPDGVLPLEEYLRRYRPARVRPPGTLPAYSNYGVGLAGLIVANVSGMAWEDYVEQNLLEPLGMHHSTFREPWTRTRPAPMPSRLSDNVSKGYQRQAGWYQPGTFAFIGQIGPAGAMSTTATDMARWMLAHLNGGELEGARILEPETARRMHTQHWTLDARMPGMAHGFIESHPHGYRAIGHGGGTIHFLSDMQMVPELDLGVFISTNTTGGGGELISRFVPLLLERYFPPGPLFVPRPEDVTAGRPLADYTGTYRSTRRPYTTVEALFMTNVASVAVTGDGALVASAGQRPSRLEPLGGDAFRSVNTGERYLFTADASGRVNAMLRPVPVMVMERLGPLETPGFRYAVLGAAAFVMACALVGAWLRRKRPPAQSAAEAWSARLLLVTAAAWLLVYAVGLVGIGPLEDFANVFFAFPTTAFVAALWLALLAAALTVLCVPLLYPVWRGGGWPLGRRLRHTGVVLAAVATLLVFHSMNAIGFNYLSG